MALNIQPCTIADIPVMIDLLVEDAQQRHARNPILWAFNGSSRERIESIVRNSLEDENATVKEHWLMARSGGKPVAITHSIIVPVPPIYVVETPPGLMLDECYVGEGAPPETIEKMIEATEAILRDQGAENFIASCCTGSPWRTVLEGNGFTPVTLFMSKSGFEDGQNAPSVGVATEDDIPGIIARSAEHRANLFDANSKFWNIHRDADAIFEKWMRISLTLTDRSMIIEKSSDKVDGYIIAQPVTQVQMPMSHDPAGIGAIDDFYHIDFGNRSEIRNGGAGATALLAAAEGAFARSETRAALVVCPDNWRSKKSFLKSQGYTTAKTWLLKA